MKFSELVQIDNSIELISSSSSELEISAIAHYAHPKKKAIVFIKNKKFYDRVVEKLFDTIWQEIGIIIEKKFYQSLNGIQEKFYGQVAFVATVADVDIAITKLSRPFYDAIFKDLNEFKDGRQLKSAAIGESCLIAENVFIGDKCKIGKNVTLMSGVALMAGSEVGDGTIIFPNVVIYPLVKIGKSVRIHAGSIIGGDGFGYHFFNGAHQKIWHVGGVIIEDEVELGAHVTIDCGTFSPTFIGAGSKLDDQVHVAHNCYVGKGVILCGQVGMAGSSTVLDYSIIGGKTAITNDIVIGKQCKVAGMAGVSQDWPDGSIIAGHPARKLNEWLRGVAFLRKKALGEGRGEG